jgi:hypothetical protein
MRAKPYLHLLRNLSVFLVKLRAGRAETGKDADGDGSKN